MTGVEEHTIGTFLAREPRILVTGMPGASGPLPVGFAGAPAYLACEEPGIVVLSPMWTLHKIDYRAPVLEGLHMLRRARPKDFLVMLLADESEEKFMKDMPVDAYYFVQKSCFIDTRIFSYAGQSKERRFDAIYNARVRSYKRHVLCTELTSLGLICADFDETARAEIREMLPAATMLNLDGDGQPTRLWPANISRLLERAGCGLMLSGLEGANWATTEYLAKGLPVVTTSNKGGRNRCLTPQNSVICKPTPGDVADGVRFVLTFDAAARDFIAADAQRQIANEQRYFQWVLREAVRQFSGVADWAGVPVPHKAPSQGRPMSYFLEHVA